jgi:hypothetical protein
LAHGYVANMRGAEHPDVFSAIFEYPDFMATWTLNYDNAYLNGWSITFQGDKATMILDEAGYQVFTEPWKRGATPSMQENTNFAECVKSRKQPNCPVEIAAQAVAGPHLANIAMLRHRRVSLGPDGITTESGD